MFNLEIMMIEQDYYDKTIIMIKQEEIWNKSRNYWKFSDKNSF